jgi:drug/metabolite transporter (DMT)-like permease
MTRPSLSGAFRSSFRSIDLRGDLRALPRLVRHWSFFVPVVLTGLAVVLFQYFPKESLVAAFFGYFSGVTPFGAVLFGGFFAPRASWLVGALISIVAAGFLAASLTVQYGGLPDNVFIDTGVTEVRLISSNVAKAEIPEFVLQAVTAGAIYGAFFAAAAAWYRRFLNRASPNRPRPSTPTGRRPDGKVPKKQSQRPMLARRR